MPFLTQYCLTVAWNEQVPLRLMEAVEISEVTFVTSSTTGTTRLVAKAADKTQTNRANMTLG
jgi:hypothetical protein